ncbi:PREDICTED: heptahelical transmembrane protein 3-like [Camelina sativa]|uniref:Heptahelical transmembrane protein 3-like n=1 Tax=Camelina sativa TaxID=90675 RepID=A0ABM0WAB7_CAMSA|nr:PREDICTED: heptahelical transmembrane protein 3-like [Camelina sativa]
MGSSAVIPATHVLCLYWDHPNVFIALGYEIATGFSYALGAAFYVSRVPERWKPGGFDMAGHSHQIFHVFVVFGALAHCLTTLFIIDFILLDVVIVFNSVTSTSKVISISTLGLLAIITLLSPALSSPRFRANLSLAMGSSAVIPATHVLCLYWDHPNVFIALGYEIATGFSYALGAAFYVSRVPERWKPGGFDMAGHSHQIFHVFVVFGALAHCLTTLFIIDFVRASPSCGI